MEISLRPTGGEQLIVLIDKSRTARRLEVLRAAMNELSDTHENSNCESLSVQSFAPVQRADIESARLASESPIMVVAIVEDKLAYLSEGVRLPRVVCESLSCGYELIKQVGVENDLYFAVPERVTGLDVISMLLSGARGVVGMQALGCSKVLETLICATRGSDKRLNRIVVGHPYRRLDQLIQTARVRWQIGRSHWELLLALAEIPLLRLPSEYPPKQKQIADEIGAFVQMTGYAVTSTTQRKLPVVLQLVAPEIGILNDDQLVSDQEVTGRSRFLDREEMFELPYLPLYAREIGLPSTILPVRGVEQSNLAIQLYKGLRGIDVASTHTHEGVTLANVTVARDL